MAAARKLEVEVISEIRIPVYPRIGEEKLVRLVTYYLRPLAPRTLTIEEPTDDKKIIEAIREDVAKRLHVKPEEIEISVIWSSRKSPLTV